jgi:hypothetical protein
MLNLLLLADPPVLVVLVVLLLLPPPVWLDEPDPPCIEPAALP